MSGCEEVRAILIAVARGENVSPPGTRFLREHVETCGACRRRLANERMLTAGLSALAAATPATPPASIKAAMIAEFRGTGDRFSSPVNRGLWQRFAGVRAWSLAAAVAAALLLAFFLPRWRRQETPVRQAEVPVVAVLKPRVVKPPVVELPATPPAVIAGSKAAHKAPRRAKPQPAPVDDPPEVATDFIEIPYVEPLRPDQRADVFRVQMPRANMAVFGLPVVGGRLDSRITADVLMGEDGVVRAVRFIR